MFAKVPTNVSITSSGGDVTVVLPQGSTRYLITRDLAGGDYSASVPTTTGRRAAHQISVSSGGGNVNITEAS